MPIPSPSSRTPVSDASRSTSAASTAMNKGAVACASAPGRLSIRCIAMPFRILGNNPFSSPSSSACRHTPRTPENAAPATHRKPSKTPAAMKPRAAVIATGDISATMKRTKGNDIPHRVDISTKFPMMRPCVTAG